MVEWTDAEHSGITSLWSKIDVGETGPQALSRHFASFGNLSTSTAILGNPKVAQHGKTVMGGLERVVKSAYAGLRSTLHSEKLHVDPDNFRLLAECISVCVAAKFGPSVFTAEFQESWQKLLAVVVSALGRQYH